MIRQNKMIGWLLLILISTSCDMYPCLTTLINDQGSRILVYNKKDKTIIALSKNEKRRFGSPKEHAYFVIYVQQPKARLFTRMYTCQQNECGDTGDVRLKLSDIINRTQVTELFTIIKHEPHSSMVQDLPIMSRK